MLSAMIAWKPGVLMTIDVRIKRVYEAASPSDGRRVLVDRLWPRGIGRDAAKIDEWLKELGPSSRLREWFGHDPGRFDEFKARYRHELAGRRDELSRLRALAREGTLTLVYSARDERHNQAMVLAEAIRRGLPPAGGSR